MSDTPIYVTQPLLPELDEFLPYLEQIWASKQLTNGGTMHRQLEQQLAEYLGVEHVALFNNGTIALLVNALASGGCQCCTRVVQQRPQQVLDGIGFDQVVIVQNFDVFALCQFDAFLDPPKPHKRFSFFE